MPRHREYVPQGVIPALLLPFHEDLSIDETTFRAHLRDAASVDGISAVTINAHASEVASCSFDEQKRVLEIAQDEIGASMPIINGVYAEGSLEAARIAKMAQQGGASALLVFPSGIFTFGQRPEMAVAHFKRLRFDPNRLVAVLREALQRVSFAFGCLRERRRHREP